MLLSLNSKDKSDKDKKGSHFFKPSGQSLPDRAAVHDQFEIGKYINGLAKFIKSCKTPMTIAIQGDWGTGKTSIMRMVQNKIEEAEKESGEKNIKIINFNTWQFSQFNMDKGLPLIMLERLISMLQYEDSHMSNFRSDESIDALKRVLATIGDLIGGTFVQGDINIVKRLFEGNAIKEFAQLGDKFENLIEDILDIPQEKKSDADNQLEEQGSIDNDKKRVVFFIDDLDRLEPAIAVELLEVLKLFLDCPHCVYVLAIDYSVVIRGVKAKYGKDFDEEKGRAFFDKIIQVPFQVPVERYDLNNFVKLCMQETGIIPSNADGLDKINDVKNYTLLIKTSIGNNPRAIKRLFNSFLLLEDILGEESRKDEQKSLLLFALQCMQNTSSFYPFYQYLIQKRDDADMIDDLKSLNSIDSEFYNLFKVKENQREKFEDDKEKFVNFIGTLYRMLSIQENTDKNSAIWKQIIEVISYSSDTAVNLQSSSASIAKPYSYFAVKYSYKGQEYKRGDYYAGLGILCRKMIADYIVYINKNIDEKNRLKTLLAFRHELKKAFEEAHANMQTKGNILFISTVTQEKRIDVEFRNAYDSSTYVLNPVYSIRGISNGAIEMFHINISKVWFVGDVPVLINTLKKLGYDPMCIPLK